MIRWTTIHLPTKHELRAAWCDGAGLVVVGGDDGVFRSTDDGRTWTAVPIGVKSWVLAVAGTATQLLAVTGGGNVLCSSDGGAHWKKEKTPPRTGPLRGVTVAADGRAWAVGANGLLARTADGAWTTDAAHRDYHAIWQQRDGTVCALGDGGILLQAPRGGGWSKIPAPGGRLARGCGAGKALIVQAETSILCSVDRGASWTRITPKDDLWGGGMFGDGEAVYVALRDGGVLRWSGGTWERLRGKTKIAGGFASGCARGARIICVRTEALDTSPALDGPAVNARLPAPTEATVSGDEALLERLLVRWRETRCPALADRIDALSARAAPPRPQSPGPTQVAQHEHWLERAALHRAGELGWLLESFTGADARHHVDQRLAALAAWPADPRIAGLLARLVETPPWTGENARRFWELVGELLVKLGDHRALPVLARVEAACAPRDRSYLVRWFRRHLPKLRARLAATAVTKLAATELATLDKAIAASAPQITTTASAAALLEAIYAQPDDDATRLVYADLLSSRGDPRGELIVLQLGGATTAPRRKRVAALLAAHGRTWLGAIEPVVLATDLVFERGFVARCRVQARVAQVAAQMIGRREWRTVRAIDVSNWDDDSWLDLVRHDAMAGVRELTGASRALLAENRALPYTHLGLGRGTVSNRVDWIRELVACRHLPALRSLALRGAWGTPADLAKLWTSTLGAGLTHFSVTSTALAPWFERLATLELASFAIEPAGPGAGWSLEGTRVGDRLVVEARYHERSKSSQPLPELWAHLEAMTPARIGRLVIAQARSLGSAVAFRKQLAKRFPHVELVL